MLLINNYPEKLKYSLNFLTNFIKTSSRNLILINIDSPIIVQAIYSFLHNSELPFLSPSEYDIKKVGTVGDFLRANKSDLALQKDVLVLDFFTELNNMFQDEKDFISTINANRDLFTQTFNTVIVFTSPAQTLLAKSYALDFRSCIDSYIDTTKWHCMPLMIPLVKIRTFANTTQLLIKSYSADEQTFIKYNIIKKEIDATEIYSHKTFVEILNAIESIPKGVCYFDLWNRFVEKITSVEAKRSSNQQRIADLDSLNLHRRRIPLLLVDTQIVLAEFFYECGELSRAILCYQNALQTLVEEFDDECKECIIAFLTSNILVTKYSFANIHSPSELLSNISERLTNASSKLKDFDDFKNTYFLLLKASVEHHSMSEHKAIFFEMKKNSKTKIPMLDISKPYALLELWEDFESNCMVKDINCYNDPMFITNILIQKMLSEFYAGNYHEAHLFFKKAKYITKNYGYEKLLEILTYMGHNMHTIYMLTKAKNKS